MFLINVRSDGSIISQTPNNLFYKLTNIFSSKLNDLNFQITKNSKLYLLNIFEENYTVNILKIDHDIFSLIFDNFKVFTLFDDEIVSIRANFKEDEKCVAFCILKGYLKDKEIIIYLNKYGICYDEFKVKYIVKCLLLKFNTSQRTVLQRLLARTNLTSYIPKQIIYAQKNHNKQTYLCS